MIIILRSISDLNSKAYKDSLTRVKNKSAYDLWVHQIDETLKSPDERASAEFAVLMFDCNLLKEINDKYGHQHSDVYLKQGSDLICKTFVHSPVFRVGGDEFIVILQGEDYRDRRELMEQFEIRSKQINTGAENPWEKVNMAVGMSVFNPRFDTSVESVYKRADLAMYKNKREWKQNRQTENNNI